ncbi:MAG: glycosyltransferase [Pseudonocardiaceae bacterium]
MIIVQNLSAPWGRRVWFERQALCESGHAVSDICPRGPGDPPYDVRDGVHLHKGQPRAAGVRLVYLGIMGPQDEVDLVIRITAILAHRMGHDVHTALLGFGDSFDDLVELTRQLDVEDRVTFTGRADLKTIGEYLSSADVGLCPGPLSPLNDVSTMNKTMEYMSYALPVVALAETRVSAGARRATSIKLIAGGLLGNHYGLLAYSFSESSIVYRAHRYPSIAHKIV